MDQCGKCVAQYLCCGSGDMKDWLMSDGGDQWSVELGVRDLAGHLDHRLVVVGGVLGAALPFGFRAKLEFLRSI